MKLLGINWLVPFDEENTMITDVVNNVCISTNNKSIVDFNNPAMISIGYSNRKSQHAVIKDSEGRTLCIAYEQRYISSKHDNVKFLVVRSDTEISELNDYRKDRRHIGNIKKDVIMQYIKESNSLSSYSEYFSIKDQYLYCTLNPKFPYCYIFLTEDVLHNKIFEKYTELRSIAASVELLLNNSSLSVEDKMILDMADKDLIALLIKQCMFQNCYNDTITIIQKEQSYVMNTDGSVYNVDNLQWNIPLYENSPNGIKFRLNGNSSYFRNLYRKARLLEFKEKIFNIMTKYDISSFSFDNISISNVSTFGMEDPSRLHSKVLSNLYMFITYNNINKETIPSLYSFLLGAYHCYMNKTTNSEHDLRLYFEVLQDLFKLKKFTTDFIQLLALNANNENSVVFEISTLNTIRTILARTKVSKLKDVLSFLKEDLANNTIHVQKYKSFFKQIKSDFLYQDVLDVCSNYVNISLTDLKRGTTRDNLDRMNKKLKTNIVAPVVLKGKDIRPELLAKIINHLLLHDSTPTAKQKKLYYHTSTIQDYNNISNEQYTKILDSIALFDKQYVNMIQGIDGYRVEVLDANDYRNFITGEATECCMTLGTKKLKDYTTVPAFNQIIITKETEDSEEIVVSSVVWKDLKNNLVLDNIEAIHTNKTTTLIYKTLLLEIVSEIISEQDFDGVVQGSSYNDIKLYDDNDSSYSEIPIAIGTDGNYYQGFYSDAEDVYTSFIDPITGETILNGINCNLKSI